MSLDALIADAKARAKVAKKTKAKARRELPGEAFHRTVEELRQMKLDACVPVSVHLRMTIQTCECGEVFNSINSWPLVMRKSPTLTHFEAVKSDDPNALAPYNALPRFLEIKRVDIPWCETCFANATTVEVPNV